MQMLAALFCCLLLALPVAGAAAPLVTVKPQESNELFANPGMGWQTFGYFNDTDRALQGLPSASAYFRFYWREIEPTDGAIDFARLDEMLAHPKGRPKGGLARDVPRFRRLRRFTSLVEGGWLQRTGSGILQSQTLAP